MNFGTIVHRRAGASVHKLTGPSGLRRRRFAGAAATAALVAALSFAAAALVAALTFAGAAWSQTGGRPLREGEIITYEEVARLRPFLPRVLWAYRHYVFYPKMRMEIGASHRDYAPSAAYRSATERHAAAVSLGPGDALVGYTAGQPFPMDAIDCANDPSAGAKIMWNHAYAWEGDGQSASFLLSFWDRGERLESFYEGRLKSVQLAHRVEPTYLEDKGGDLFRGERRKSATLFEVDAPRSARGIRILSHRYKRSDAASANGRGDDIWIFFPGDRQVMRVEMKTASEALPGTSMVLEDLGGFGLVPEYTWTCLGEMDVLAPVNSRARGYPYDRDHDFGPLGLSLASDRWEQRRAVAVRMVPRDPEHHYGRKELVLDRQTLRVLYSFAYDRKDELWKITLHNGRWSEDDARYYTGWQGVPSPRDAKTVADVTINVQTDTGSRLEYWDNHGTPMGRGDVRRLLEPHRHRVH